MIFKLKHYLNLYNLFLNETGTKIKEETKPRRLIKRSYLLQRVGLNLNSFNQTTMPSVKRPETSSSTNRPLMVKL